MNENAKDNALHCLSQENSIKISKNSKLVRSQKSLNTKEIKKNIQKILGKNRKLTPFRKITQRGIEENNKNSPILSRNSNNKSNFSYYFNSITKDPENSISRMRNPGIKVNMKMHNENEIKSIAFKKVLKVTGNCKNGNGEGQSFLDAGVCSHNQSDSKVREECEHTSTTTPIITPKVKLTPITGGKSKPKTKHRVINMVWGEKFYRDTTPIKGMLCNTKNIPLRTFCAKSREGIVISTGNKKINQDNFISRNSILGFKDFAFFSIFDGHGINGHYISELVKNKLVNYFSKSEIYYIPRYGNLISLPSLNSYITEEEIYAKLRGNNYEMINNSIRSAQDDIKVSPFEVNFSGTTACSVFIIGNHLICSNVGDSRAIMAQASSLEEENFEIIQLSRDHKPEIESEKMRIVKMGGCVKKISQHGVDIGPYRVWVKDQNYPGIAMSRSLGDLVAKSIGVIPEPDVFEYEINTTTRYIVLASDGIWEHMNNIHVEEIVTQCYRQHSVDLAVDKLIDEATQCYFKLGQNSDDITVIVIFFTEENN